MGLRLVGRLRGRGLGFDSVGIWVLEATESTDTGLISRGMSKIRSIRMIAFFYLG